LFHVGGIGNFAQYDRPEVNGTIDEALQTYDSKDHLELCRRVQRMVMDDVPCFPLLFLSQAFAVSARVRDLEMIPFDMNDIFLGKTWLTKPNTSTTSTARR